jgi:hypothetical protein
MIIGGIVGLIMSFNGDIDTLEKRLDIETLALEVQTEKVARDDVLLNLFLEHPWVREKKVYHRWYIISNGETVHAFTQYPDPDKTYQLSY